eukprot:CAMPEP_0168195848 /NCGR_PEP_ID=MMETSP0139_2-20121125/20133_1 /TAXON_ID=44445 /ORGANISM="Pseudo-nitzschia australis, Strain 10249 10 AB" /LENGTH=36 /DNA_ID= /DNA_START= /DNA_END= /DNA_ORIENTATION=
MDAVLVLLLLQEATPPATIETIGDTNGSSCGSIATE